MHGLLAIFLAGLPPAQSAWLAADAAVRLGLHPIVISQYGSTAF